MLEVVCGVPLFAATDQTHPQMGGTRTGTGTEREHQVRRNGSDADAGAQALNVFRMRLLGASVRPVTAGTATLKDATSEAIRDWVTNVESTHYILGSAAGPHPYPMMVRLFATG